MLPKEVTQFIGRSGGVRVFEVEKGAIRKFADAVGDRNPLYWDEEYARKTKYGAIISPPGFFGWPVKWPESRTFPLTFESEEGLATELAKVGYGRGLDGGIEFEFFAPIRAGDTLAVTTMVKDLIEREGKTGKMVFVILENSYLNQNGDLVAKVRFTHIRR